MKKQFELLNNICSEFYQTSEEFDSLEYVYKFNPEEGWVGTELITIINGIARPIHLTDSSEDKIKDLCKMLHDKMQAHTGGDWRKMVLTINEEGKVNTKFSYEIQSCMDQFKE